MLHVNVLSNSWMTGKGSTIQLNADGAEVSRSLLDEAGDPANSD